MSGLFGAHSASQEDLDAIHGRLSELRRQSIVRFPAAGFADDRCPHGAPNARWGTLISGACIAPGNVNIPGTPATNRSIVSFVGHLATPVSGVDIPTSQPAEVVRAAYGRWGTGCFARLNGNFSVAICDPQLPGLVIARDAAGTKPIFYSCSDNCVFGSSAIEVLHACGRPAIANTRVLLRYTVHGTPDGISDTLFEGVQALPAAHYLEVVSGCLPRVCPINHGIIASPSHFSESFAQSSEKLRRVLLDTIKAQSTGENVGVAVSGGIDSSGIIACLRKAVGPDEPLHAFSFVHGHKALPPAWDERSWAELATSHVRATLHPVRLEPAAIPGAMSRIFSIQNFPFGSPVVLAQAEVFQFAAASGIQVMLGGHGPDTLFGGGKSHIIARAAKLLRGGRVVAAWKLLQGAADYAASSPVRLLISSVGEALPVPRPRNKFLSDSWARESWFLERVAARGEKPLFETTDLMRRVILEHLYRSSVPTSLHVEECNAVGHGMETRLPYLVAAVLRLASGLPDEYLVSNTGETKCVLRGALKGLVPDAILDRSSRVGFAVPVLPWLHELKPWVDDRLSELASLPFFQPTSTSAIWEQLEGTDSFAWNTAYRTWRWITLLEWVKVHNVRFR